MYITGLFISSKGTLTVRYRPTQVTSPARKLLQAVLYRGRRIRTAAYLITSSDLKTLHPGNRIILLNLPMTPHRLIPSLGVTTCSAEMDNIKDWAARNNLTLNIIKKTTKTVIYDCRKTQQNTPPPLPGINRVDTLRVLGVTLTRRLSASDHIRRVVSECSQTLYALRVLRHHSLTGVGLHTVF